MELDATAYQFLSCYIKGAAGGERPNVYLASRQGTTETRAYLDSEDYAPLTTSLRRVDIPLNDFETLGVNLAKLA